MDPLQKSDDACFVCGMQNPGGLRIPFTIDADAQRAEGTTCLAETFQGWHGIAHGGVIAALLDEACMHASRTTGDQMVTAEIVVRFRAPVPIGRTVRVVGEVTGQEKRIVTARGRLEVDGQLAAEAEARVFRLARSR